jgi:hypothetical protein
MDPVMLTSQHLEPVGLLFRVHGEHGQCSPVARLILRTEGELTVSSDADQDRLFKIIHNLSSFRTFGSLSFLPIGLRP